jgi:signal transduction histidine kinase
VSVVQVLLAPIADPAVGVLIAVGSTLPLLWRRILPATAALVGTVVWLVPTPGGFLVLGYVVGGLLYYSVGLHVQPMRRLVLVTAVGTAVAVLAALRSPLIDDPVAIGSVLVVLGPVIGGRLIAHARAQNARLQQLTAELVRERARAEQSAVAEERARIARELHDVIGHEVSVIALQADAAAAALRSSPERAAAPVAAIRAAAGTALTEMRRAVGLLRDVGEDDRHPQPGLADIPDLVAATQEAGTPVACDLRPPDVPLSPGLQLTVYRLVQEALTNARRHAPGSTVRVCVHGRESELCVEVVSSGGRVARDPGGGHGLIGMRERVRMHGGALMTGPADDGFAVRARLPLALPAAP